MTDITNSPLAPAPNGRGLGWRKEAVDLRDRRLFRDVPSVATLAERIDIEELMPEPLDQGPVGACTGYSSGEAFYGIMKKDGHRHPFMPSPVALYHGGREIGGYLQDDGGAEIRNVFKWAAKVGLPRLSELKPRFNEGDLADPTTGIFPEKSIWRRPLSASVLKDAEKRQVVVYYKLPTINELLACLSQGWPAVVGVELFPSFFGSDGNPLVDIPEPQAGERTIGGHAIAAIGYDRTGSRPFVRFRNSWGPTAHQGGPNFTLSLAYLQVHGADWWTARFIEGGKPA